MERTALLFDSTALLLYHRRSFPFCYFSAAPLPRCVLSSSCQPCTPSPGAQAATLVLQAAGSKEGGQFNSVAGLEKAPGPEKFLKWRNT